MKKREFIKKIIVGTGILYFPINSYSLAEFNYNKGNNLKESFFYFKIPKGVMCKICPKECTLTNGELADCKNRINQDGKLYSIAYGNPCSVHIDPIEKLPLFHYLPSNNTLTLATAGCNLSCLNCQNWEMSQFSPYETTNYDYMPEKVIEEAIRNDCQTIAFSYTEPTTFLEYVYDTAKLAKENNLNVIVKTAGFINEEPLRMLCKYVDAFNVDLKSFSNRIYSKLNGGSLEPILNSLKTIKDEGKWLEITNLIIPTWTDDLKMIKKMCTWLAKNGFENTPLHFGRFFPEHKLLKLPPTPLKTLFNATEIAKEEGIKYVYLSGIQGNENSDTICPNCNKKLVTRKGYRITQNKLINDNCPFCSFKIEGRWI